MGCGKLGLAEAIVVEPQPHDVQFIGYQPLTLDEGVAAWVAAWPRLTTIDGTKVLVGSGVRVADRAGLQKAIAGTPQGWTRARLVELGMPSEPPPATLPPILSGFAEIWHGLSLNDETPLEELMQAATRFNGPRLLAREVLARRSDLAARSAQWRASREDDLREWGRFLAKEFSLS
jgi:hypothetical protein